MPRTLNRILLGAALTAIALILVPSFALGAAKEYQVKAAYLYNFAKFIEWPERAFAGREAPIVICILGEDRFEGNIDKAIAGKSIKGRPLAVKRQAEGSAAPAGNVCHILFVSSSETGREGELLSALNGKAVVTVGEVDGFASNGGVLNFALDNGKIKVELNIAAATGAGVKVSSKLQKIATSVGN